VRSWIDHLVVACADLDQGEAWLVGQLGVAPQPGGRHATMGTHNRLLKLGARCYLELIAIDPDGEPPARPRWFDLDREAVRARVARSPFLHTWVAATDDLHEAVRSVPALGGVHPFARNAYRWRFALTDDGSTPFSGLLPALIQWDADADGRAAHPTDGLEDRGCALVALELAYPDTASLLALFRDLRISGPVELRAGAADIAARIRTPRGDDILLR
jgi:Glyoxalase-like domain